MNFILKNYVYYLKKDTTGLDLIFCNLEKMK